MINAITKKDFDPISEFSNLWLNTDSGALFVWDSKPIKVGFAKDFVVVTEDVFNVDFSYVEKRNHENYSKVFDYHKIPIKVIAEVVPMDYEGSDVEVRFGDVYGTISPKMGVHLISQCENVVLDGKLEISCKPTRGKIQITLHVISYE